ncbi:uncharacterized protein N7482_000381 [Penicillium canariense]|uniref:Uncharacterized protein n=1 Tax=Penicillium canariense TaxID=189055 RepID=A0A9W9IBG2_9EURO|nr:uncharacterized protein N7482_000381 [Penicillium canariense]KAJ5174504.1 hypothetical protein N7482_000381 [Penicillium canariense]
MSTSEMSASDNGGSGTTPDTAHIRWQFIDASNNSRSNLTQVKRHVMHEYMRQKKGTSGNSESEEDSSRPAKRGRSKKTRAAKRKSAKGAAEPGTGSNQPKPTQKQAQPPEEEGVSTDMEEIGQDWFSGASDPSLAVQALANTAALPLRASPVQPQGSLLPTHDIVDISLESQSQAAEFNGLVSRSAAPTTPLEFTRSPRTILSAARTDPFNTLPMELDLEG